MYCIVGGQPFVERLKAVAANAKAVIAWGACASWGCVQAARPNPTNAVPIDKVITDKPIIKVPGCPPIAEVMTGVISYILTFDKLPELDSRGRPAMFYGQRIHDKCYRRPHFDAGEFVESWDDDGARKGYCLYKMGCKGPTTYNACSTIRWKRRLLPHPVRPRLYRLLGGELLGQRALLPASPPSAPLSASKPPLMKSVKSPPLPWVRHRRPRRRQRPRAPHSQAPNRTTGAARRAEGRPVMTGIATPNGFSLDNSGRRMVVDPVTRIEGHMRCEVNLDENNIIRNAVSSGTSGAAWKSSSKAATRVTPGLFANASVASAPAPTRSPPSARWKTRWGFSSLTTPTSSATSCRRPSTRMTISCISTTCTRWTGWMSCPP